MYLIYLFIYFFKKSAQNLVGRQSETEKKDGMALCKSLNGHDSATTCPIYLLQLLAGCSWFPLSFPLSSRRQGPLVTVAMPLPALFDIPEWPGTYSVYFEFFPGFFYHIFWEAFPQLVRLKWIELGTVLRVDKITNSLKVLWRILHWSA